MKREPIGPGEESVWDYPRPPQIAPEQRRVTVYFADALIVDSLRAVRVLETSHPPTIYVPPQDVRLDLVSRSSLVTVCEFKGRAEYWNLVVGTRRSDNAAWSYPNPTRCFERLKDHFCIYPSRVDACFLGIERVEAQDGDFYGGWITAEIKGPFKGGRGTFGW